MSAIELGDGLFKFVKERLADLLVHEEVIWGDARLTRIVTLTPM